MVTNNTSAEPSYKTKTAIRYGIPVVSVNFINACMEHGKLVDVDQFLVFGESASSQFKSGKILSGECF